MKNMAYKTQQFLRKIKLFKKLKLIKKSNNITVFNTSKEVLFIKKCLLLGRMNQSYKRKKIWDKKMNGWSNHLKFCKVKKIRHVF